MTPQRRQRLIADTREFRDRVSVAAVKRENGPRAGAYANLRRAIDGVLAALEAPESRCH
jgi:hypothetical protein